jgi:putative transposase
MTTSQVGATTMITTLTSVDIPHNSHQTLPYCRGFAAAQPPDLHRLEEIFRDVCADFEVELREFNGESDHVHFLINYPPKVRLSELINSLKGVSSRRLQQEFPAIKVFSLMRKSRGVLWTPSSFAGTVGGAPLSALKQYIEQQKGADDTSSR